jgi:hypothetical protein
VAQVKRFDFADSAGVLAKHLAAGGAVCKNQLTPLRGHNMGWSFRRSKSFGPFRFNFSKSGIGFSFGAPGGRIGVSSKGKKYFRGGIPSTGLYYQSTLPDAPRTQDGQASPPASSSSPLGASGVTQIRPCRVTEQERIAVHEERCITGNP